MHAFWMSVGMHAAGFALVHYAQASLDNAGLAQPPVSSLQARLFTYEAGQGQRSLATADPDPGAVQAEPVAVPAVAPLPTLQAAAAAPAPLATERVYSDSELDASPTVVSSVTLEYPLAANNREGTVTLAIVVAGNGTVEDVSVVSAVPPGFFEAAAIAGFKQAQFSPGLLGGLGVKSRLVVQVEFMPMNRGGSVAGQR
ncbi:energy transducer TonB [Rhodoferax lacus]|uniref:energy transducer TonB n=1 Tax=Rhodoferax lacus TaxID=2184758 RepID=UPI001F48488B|nr:energy transducer TonB [Rhodoferax lacus]